MIYADFIIELLQRLYQRTVTSVKPFRKEFAFTSGIQSSILGNENPNMVYVGDLTIDVVSEIHPDYITYPKENDWSFKSPDSVLGSLNIVLGSDVYSAARELVLDWGIKDFSLGYSNKYWGMLGVVRKSRVFSDLVVPNISASSDFSTNMMSTHGVIGEEFTSSYDVAVSLGSVGLDVRVPVVVSSVDGVTNFVEGTDYVMDLVNGTIKVLSTGTMLDVTAYKINYNFLSVLSQSVNFKGFFSGFSAVLE